MSAINGDKARFNRNRKAKIARRARKRKHLTGLKQQSSSNAPGEQQVKVSA
jgi:hypothetical protein